MKHLWKRMLALMLALAMVCTSGGMTVLAEEASAEARTAVADAGAADDEADADASDEDLVTQTAATVVASTVASTEDSSTSTDAILYGDVDKDGDIDSDDVTALRKAISGKLTEGYEQGDVNGDGKLSTLDITLINQYISGTITYFPVGEYYESGASWVTRAEWIHQLVTIYGMSIEDESSMTTCFTDLDGCEYADEIEIAANIGVFAIDSDEFDPDDYVTREFAAHTMNYCAGYMDDMDVYPSDLEDCYYQYDVQVAVSKGWLELVGKEFRKDLYVTTAESTAMLATAETLAQKIEIDENYDNQIEYSDDVIMVDDSVTATISDDVVTVQSDEIIILDGDVFSVTIDGEQYFYVAKSVDTDKNGYSVITVTDAELSDYVEYIDIQGYAEVDYENVESCYDGVTVEYVAASTAASMSSVATDLAESDETATDETATASVSGLDAITLNLGSISIDGEIALSDSVKVKVNGSLSNITPTFDMNYDPFNGLQEFYFNVDAEASITGTLTGKLEEKMSKEVKIASLPVVGLGVLSANIDIVVTVTMTGTVTVSLVWDVSGGVQYTQAEGWRIIKSFQKKSVNIEAECTESIAVKVAMNVKLAKTTIGEMYLMGGEKGTASLKTQDDGEVCTTLNVYLFAEVGAKLSIFGKEFSQSCQFINASNSPFKLKQHWEDGVAVSACTYTDDDDDTSSSSSDTSRKAYDDTGIAFDGEITAANDADSKSDGSRTVIEEDWTLKADTVITGSLCLTFGTLELNGFKLTVYGNFYHKGGRLEIGSGVLDIEGDYIASDITYNSVYEVGYGFTEAYLDMSASNGQINVAGDFIWYGYSDYLAEGVITVTGDFIVKEGNYLESMNNHMIVLNGTGTQTVSIYTNTDDIYAYSASCSFDQLKIENSDSREIIWSGHLDVAKLLSDSDEVTIVSDDLILYYLGMNNKKVTVKGDVTIAPDKWNDGNIDLEAGVLEVEGNVMHAGGWIVLNNGTLNVHGDYAARIETKNVAGGSSYESSTARLQMDNESDTINVDGDFIWYSEKNPEMSAGTITITGDFVHKGGSFYTGDDLAIFMNGTGTQTITVCGDTDVRFGQLKIENSGSREIVWSGYMNIAKLLSDTNEVTIVPDNLIVDNLGMNQKTLIIKGDMTLNTTGSWNEGIDVDGGVLEVEGNFSDICGLLNVNNGTVNIEGNYAAQLETINSAGESSYAYTGASLYMTESSCKMNVAGDFVWYGDYSYLKAGTLTITGDFINRGGDFENSEDHVIVLNGTGTQTVSDASEKTVFGKLQIENADSRNIVWEGKLHINDLLTNMTIEPNNLVIHGLNVNNNQLIINGDVTVAAGTVDVNVGLISISGNLLHTDGGINVNNGTLSIGGRYAAQYETENYAGDIVCESSSAYLYMNGAYGVMTVAGDFTWYGNTADLTAGTLSIGGDFTDKNTYKTFAASDNHKTILNGTSNQTVTFGCTDAKFNILQLTRDKDTYTFSYEPCWNTLLIETAECDHVYGNYISNNDATCTQDGTKTATCLICGETVTVTDEGSATGHSWGTPTFTWSSDFTSATAVFTCTVCGETSEAVSADVTTEQTAATCTEDGLITFNATVTWEGQDYFCTGVNTILATGHGDTEVRDAVEATCTSIGYTGDTYCTVCGEKIASGTVIAATGHNYVSEVTKEATARTDGVLTYTCTKCGDTYTEVIPATGVVEVDLSDCSISLSGTSYTYDGTAKQPTVTVTYDGASLTKNTDYTVEYSNNVNAGTATVTVTGQGDYTGTVTKNFTISKASQQITLSGTSVSLAVGGSSSLTASASGGGSISWTSSDTSVATVSNGQITGVASGSATITVTAAATDNYNAATETITVTVTASDLSEATVTLSSYSFVYSGFAKKPTVTVKLGSTTLVSGTDYTVTYSNNTVVGTATVTVTGCGSYTGTATATFTISKASQTVSVNTKGASSIRIGAKTIWTAKSSGNGEITYSTTASSSVGTVNSISGLVTAKGVGTIKVYATAAATSNYKASSKTLIATITVGLSAPAISSVTQSSTTITVKWAKITGAGGYYVYRSTSKNGTYSKVKTITSGSTVSYKDTSSKTNGKTYYYKVYAYSGSTKSSASSAKSITYMKGTVSSLTNVSSGITVKWSKVSGATGYYVYRKASTASSYTLVKKLTNGSTVSYTDTGVKSKNGTTYTYYVQPYKGSSKGAYATKTTVRLTAVSISSLKNSSSKKMTVKWGKNAKATGYEIQYSTSSSFTSKTTKTVTISKAATSSRTIGSLTKGKKYYVRIRAYKKVSNTKYYSAWSSKKGVKISK